VQIKGQGTVAFICKNGGRQSFVGVYFIPQLTTNILSVSQLDEAWYKVDIYSGMMKICELGGQLLASVR
jgi:hypothetical protein